QKSGHQHVEIAGVDDVGRDEPVPTPCRQGGAIENCAKALCIFTIKRPAEVDVFPLWLDLIFPAHHEADDAEAIVTESLHTTPNGGVRGVVAEESDTGHGGMAASGRPGYRKALQDSNCIKHTRRRRTVFPQAV